MTAVLEQSTLTCSPGDWRMDRDAGVVWCVRCGAQVGVTCARCFSPVTGVSRGHKGHSRVRDGQALCECGGFRYFLFDAAVVARFVQSLEKSARQCAGSPERGTTPARPCAPGPNLQT